MSSSHDLSRFAPGSILLDRYKAVRVVGAGGMGVVVHAVHLIEGDEVAIKFLLPQFASSREAAARFVREARAATKIPSEHITRVLDTGTSPDLGPFIVMEYLPGEDLSKRIRGGLRATVPVAIDYIVQASDAIAHAHTVGVIHRDVKPANMFVVDDEQGHPLVKVLDFGISKVLEEAPLEITKTSTLLGSGLYMSPEQMRSAKTVDHRTDVYSLGISLYELLTGTQPFVADSYPDLCIKVTMEPPVPLRRYRPDVSEELAAAIAKAYARAPAERYPSVPDFALGLKPWATPETAARIDAIVALGKSRPPLQSGDFSSVAPPAPALPHPGATTIPMAPRLPDLAAAHLAAVGAAQGTGSVPPRRSGAPEASPSPSLTPAGGTLALTPNASAPPPRSPSAASLPPPALAESSSKSFTKPAPAGGTARTVVAAAIGTFVVMSGLVFAYAMFGRSRDVAAPALPAASAAPSPGAPIDPGATAATSVGPSEAPSGAASAAAAPLASAAPSESAAPDGTSEVKPEKKPRVMKPHKPKEEGASSPSGTKAQPADPYSCIDPVTKLRIPCR